MPVTFPIGVKSKSSVTHTEWASPLIELSPEDAHKLVSLDSHNWEFADGGESAEELGVRALEIPSDPEATAEIPLPELEEPAVTKVKKKVKRKVR